jgi:phosphate transport system ATP-binding protein
MGPQFEVPTKSTTKFNLGAQSDFLRSQVKNLSFSYNPKDKVVLKNVSLPIFDKKVTALIGPSGCGKTTLLRCFNRMHDLYNEVSYDGEILLYPESKNILSRDVDPMEVRMRIGMVFQKPNPFPKTIYENVAYGLRVRGIKKKSYMDEKIEHSLQQAGLWTEVKDRLHAQATSLSGGQQQRLCIARALVTDPEILLLDEPTSALDPISTSHIEELIVELKKDVTILIVTHNLHQAARCSDYTAFMYLGDLIEYGPSNLIFTNPSDKRTENYITGRFG